MIEKIEAGTMVWINGPDVWNKKPNEYIAFSKGNHLIWSRDGRTPYQVYTVTTQDPHLPKVPEWMPEGCTLWEERGEHDNYVFYSDGEGSYRTKNLPENRIHSFAVRDGKGNVRLMNSPNWYTRKGADNIWTTCDEGNIQAKLIGAVMRKATK